jgi:hypothetical protein
LTGEVQTKFDQVMNMILFMSSFFFLLTIGICYAYVQLLQLSESLICTLRAFCQQNFYPEPSFHALITCALLNHPTSSSLADSSSSPEFVTIPNFPVDLIPDLNHRFSLGLQQMTAGFDTRQVQVKIEKDIIGWQIGS